ncbi:hypothetical protein BDZ91DRAFT_716718, partial [Kalaharituber pfeilii]
MQEKIRAKEILNEFHRHSVNEEVSHCLNSIRYLQTFRLTYSLQAWIYEYVSRLPGSFYRFHWPATFRYSKNNLYV